MQCLLLVDPSHAEDALLHVQGAIPGAAVTLYAGGNLQRRHYELIIVASHLTARGMHLGGDNYLAPLALGSLAETAKANAIFIASCDGSAVALDIAGQVKAAAVTYYPAALDGDTARRLAVAFAERYVGEGLEAAISVAQAAGYQVLNPIWVTMAPGDGGFGNNPEMMRLLMEMQRQQTETAADVRYLKTEVQRIADAQTAAGNIPLRNILFLLSLAVVVTFLGWLAVNALSVRGV